MAVAIDKDYLLLHTRKVRFFGIGPDDESWGYAVPVEVIENALTLTPQNEWVSVDERLPAPTENPVLVYDCTGVNMAWYSYAMGWTHRTGLPGVEITHWMPLPEPPEKE